MIKRLLLTLVLMAAPASATVTQIIGTVVDATGTPVNGTACLKLPVNAVDTSTNRALSPAQVCFPVTNGTFPSFASIVPNDVISPAKTYYQFVVRNQAGALVFMANYVVPTGAGTFNVGLAIPTLVTTSNISFVNPVTTSASNVFTAAQTFPQINSSNGPVAGTGFLRLGNSDTVYTRNSGNTADVQLLGICPSGGTLCSADSITFGVAAGTGLWGLGLTTFNGPANADMTIQPFGSVPTAGNPGRGVILQGTSAFAPGNNPGGNITINAGVAAGTGAGGTITLNPGTSPSGTQGTVSVARGYLYPPPTTFASLAAVANGATVYCSDCTIANPCAGAGTGAIAKRLNGIWVCN